MRLSHIMTFALDVLSAWNASLSDLSFHGSFCSTVSLPYHSQKSSHGPLTTITIYCLSPYSPSLQDAFYYPAFCCRCIHAFIFHLLQGNVSSIRAWIWLVKRSADLGEFQDLESRFNHREMHKYLFN